MNTLHAPRFTLDEPATFNQQPSTRPSSRKKPELVKAGNVSLPIYKTRWYDKKRRRTYTSHIVVYRDAQGEHRIKRASRAEAVRRGQEIADMIANGEIAMAQLSQRDRADYLCALDHIRPTGKSLVSVCAGYAELHAVLAKASADVAPVTPLEAIRYYIANAITTIAPKTVPKIYAEMLALRKQDGISKNTLDDYQSRLGRFARDFTGPVLAVRGKDLDDWLSKLGTGRRTRNNYRGNLVDFYRFAKRRGYVPKTWSVLDAVGRVKDEPVTVRTFQPADFAKLITTAEAFEAGLAEKKRRYRTVIPYLAIGAWAGLRHEEMCAGLDTAGHRLPVLDWRQVNLKRKEIRVLQDVARKIGRDRTVPMSDNLVAWLKPYVRPSGPICELVNVTNAIARAAHLAKVKWIRNGHRKSYITYRLDLVKDVGRVALEAGTSPARIAKNYKAPTAPFDPRDKDEKQVDEETTAWFKIMPVRPDSDPLFAWGKRRELMIRAIG